MMGRLTKSPIEKFPAYFNFSINMLSGETIASHAVTCVDEATGLSTSSTIVDSSGIVGKEIVVVVKSGTEGDVHHIQCRAQTSGGSWFQQDLKLTIQAVVSSNFSKQPDDAWVEEWDFKKDLPSGDTINSGVAVATKESDGSDQTGVVTGTAQVVGTTVGIPVLAGTDGESYLIGFRATTVAGYVYENTVRMNVQET